MRSDFNISDIFVRELLHLIFDDGTFKTELYESKDWDIKRCLVMQKTLVKVMHRKIDIVKIESSVIEKYLKAFIDYDAASCISVWNEILLGSQGTVNQTTSCQHTLFKNNSTVHWRGTVVLESK